MVGALRKTPGASLFNLPITRLSLPSGPTLGGAGQVTSTYLPSGDQLGIQVHSSGGTTLPVGQLSLAAAERLPFIVKRLISALVASPSSRGWQLLFCGVICSATYVGF